MSSQIRLHLEILKLKPDAKLPTRALGESVGFDIHAYLKSETGRPLKIMVPPNNTRVIGTGIAGKAPPGYFIGICSRSGMATKSVFVANSPGIIDPDYTGEIFVSLYNGSVVPYYVDHEHRIAQIILFPRTILPVLEIKEMKPTLRGASGVGSTGA